MQSKKTQEYQELLLSCIIQSTNIKSDIARVQAHWFGGDFRTVFNIITTLLAEDVTLTRQAFTRYAEKMVKAKMEISVVQYHFDAAYMLTSDPANFQLHINNVKESYFRERQVQIIKQYNEDTKAGMTGPEVINKMAKATSLLAAETHAEKAQPLNYLELIRQRPTQGTPVIDGILREGGVATLVSGTKGRKSFSIAALVAGVLTGGSWFGHQLAQGRVALIDGELTAATIYFRLNAVFNALKIKDEAAGGLDLWALRGRSGDSNATIENIKSKGPGFYKLIVVDPLYCFYPDDPRFSENDNAAMRKVYDRLIGVASETRAAIMIVHHLSKGEQSTKGISDLGSGAGAISRASDAHLTFRSHQEKDTVVFDGVVRDFPVMTPTCWRWYFPTFEAALDLDAGDLQGVKRKGPVRGFIEEPWNANRFASRFITNEGKEMFQLQSEAEEAELSGRKVETLVKQCVMGKLAHKWGGKPGNPAKYANRPETINNKVSDDEPIML